MTVAPMLEGDGLWGEGEGETVKPEERLERELSRATNRAVVQRTRDDKHRPGTVFVVEVGRIGGRKENHLWWWFESKSDSTRRRGLHGWTLWQPHCIGNATEPEGMRVFSNPGIKAVYFIMAMSRMSTSYWLVKEAWTAGGSCSR
jgi:hypothetical protein